MSFPCNRYLWTFPCDCYCLENKKRERLRLKVFDESRLAIILFRALQTCILDTDGEMFNSFLGGKLKEKKRAVEMRCLCSLLHSWYFLLAYSHLRRAYLKEKDSETQ